MTKRIIVIEDSMTFCERICNMLKRQGWKTSKAYNMRKGMELVREADELLEWMRENGYENQFVIMPDYESYSSAVAAIKKGAANYFPKSEMQGELFEFLNALWKGNEHIAKSREKIFARTSEAFTKVIELVNMFAPIQITVMILGESGTGKEHIARMIHEKSKRANKPFVTLDCGTLNEQLAAGLVVLFHVGLELLEHLVVLPQPLAAGDTEGIAHALHTGEDKADAVLCSVEQEVSGFLIEVVGLQPAEQGGAAHGALNDAVLDLYVTDLPRGKESAVFFVHEIHPFLFLSYFFTEMGNRKACPSTVFYKPLCCG